VCELRAVAFSKTPTESLVVEEASRLGQGKRTRNLKDCFCFQNREHEGPVFNFLAGFFGHKSPLSDSYSANRVWEMLKVGFMAPRLLSAILVTDPRLTVANITFFKALQYIWRGRRSVAESLANSVGSIWHL